MFDPSKDRGEEGAMGLLLRSYESQGDVIAVGRSAFSARGEVSFSLRKSGFGIVVIV